MNGAQRASAPLAGTRDGALQQTARFLEDSFGWDARDEDPFLPNALLLRSAEAIDAVSNAARSGQQRTATASGGYILCSIERF